MKRFKKRLRLVIIVLFLIVSSLSILSLLFLVYYHNSTISAAAIALSLPQQQEQQQKHQFASISTKIANNNSNNSYNNNNTEQAHYYIGQSVAKPSTATKFMWRDNLKNVTYTANSYDEMISIISRPWPKLSLNESLNWCILVDIVNYDADKGNNNNGDTAGLIFVKNTKAASSTGAGVTIQIAHNVAQRIMRQQQQQQKQQKQIETMRNNPICIHHYNHGNKFRSLNRQRPFLLWTNIRHPTKLVVSAFFHFRVGRKKIEPTVENLMDIAIHYPNRQLSYVMASPKKWVYPKDWNKYILRTNTSMTHAALQKIQNFVLNSYSFVALVERMDESLVVLKLLWNLEMQDIITLSSKRSGGYDDGRYQNQCTLVPKSILTRDMQDYINSAEFVNNNFDFVLYDVINACLDKTIEFLGKDLVHAQLQEFYKYQQSAISACQDQAIFPCSETGVKRNDTNCYWNDAGCGHGCVQQILSKQQQQQ